MLFAILLSLVVGLLGYAFYKWATLNDDYFAKRNLPHLKPKFMVGNSGDLLLRNRTGVEHPQFLYNNFPDEKIYGMFDFRRPQIIVRDPELLKRLLITDFEHFGDHRMFLDVSNDDLLGNNLFMLRGEKLREMRSALSPAFTGSKLHQMFELVSECAADTTEHFQRKASNGKAESLEMVDVFSRYTIDVIATCAFGIKVNSFECPHNEFYETGKRVLSMSGVLPILRFLFFNALPSVAKKLGVQFIPAKIGQFFMPMVLDTMAERKEKGILRPDMINTLMQLRDGLTQEHSGEHQAAGASQVKRKWTDSELVAQCFIFFIAGFETTTTALTFLMCELCLNPDIQQKLYDEIAETKSGLNGESVDFEALHKMKYLEQVTSETLRKWPAAALTDRNCTKEDNGRKYLFEKGVAFQVPILGIHRDPKYFADPEKFDPERFSDENKKDILPGTYFPFGMGPRHCIDKSIFEMFDGRFSTNRIHYSYNPLGSRLALMLMNAIIFNLVLNFSLVPNANTQIPLRLKKKNSMKKTLRSEEGVFMDFKPKKNL